MIEDMSLKGCLEFAIATEEVGSKFYERLADKFSANKEISELFSHLASDEQVHKKQFAALLKKAPEEQGTGETAENREFLKAMSVSEFFSHHRGPFKDVEKIQDRNDALQKALDFEKATLGFYKAVEDFHGKKDPLSQVIDAEKAHVVILMKYLLVEGSEFRGLQDRWP
jgi:rubrerythrin